MNRHSISPTGSAALVVALFHFGAAHAGTLSTPMIFKGGGDQLVCIASNVSSQPITVRVTIIGVLGNASSTCTLPAGDNDGCQAFRNNDAGRCTITATGEQSELRARVRGVLFTRKITSPFTIEGAVQAE